MKKFLFAFCGITAVLSISGCGNTPKRVDTIPAARPPYAAETAVSEARAAQFKKIIAPAKIRGVGIFPSAFFEKYQNSDILDAAEKLGFNRLYCCLSSEKELDERFASFVSDAISRKFDVEVVLSQQDFYRKYRGNRLIRNFFIQYPDLIKAIEKVIEFNSKLPENIRITGITVMLTPHIFTGNNTDRISGRLYRWTPKRYGIGEDNDMLMRESLQYAEKIVSLPGILPLTFAVADFLHEDAAAKRLSVGKITDFTRLAPRVAVVASGNLPSQLPGNIQSELDAAQPGQIIAVVPLAQHTSLDSGRLRRRNWNDFQRAIAYLMKKSGSHPSFAGVIVSPLAVIEFLRQEK